MTGSELVRPEVKIDELKYVITGTGRCGTVWLAKMLTANGIPCGHESIFDTNGMEGVRKRMDCKMAIMSIVSTHEQIGIKKHDPLWEQGPCWWENGLVADASFMAAPFLGRDCLKGVKKLHLIRHPIKVVNSFCNKLGFFSGPRPRSGEEWGKFVYKQLPIMTSPDLTTHDRAVLYYLKWVQMIERCKDVVVHRLEDGLTPELVAFFGKDKLEDVADSKNELMLRNSNAVFDTLDQISYGWLRDEFAELGEKYGYSMRKLKIKL